MIPMDVFLALSDPRRRRMIELLAQGSRSAGEIAARFSISAPAVSQHLKTLRKTRLVRVEVRGQHRIYALAPEGFRELDDWLARYVRFWSGRLDRLGEVIAQSVDSGLTVAQPLPVPTRSAEHNKPRKRSPRAVALEPPSHGRKRRKQ
jgi:DNA-binding transcriptional ArsR family regulator